MLLARAVHSQSECHYDFSCRKIQSLLRIRFVMTTRVGVLNKIGYQHANNHIVFIRPLL